MKTMSKKTSIFHLCVITFILTVVNVSAHEGHDRPASQSKAPAVSSASDIGDTKGMSAVTQDVTSIAQPKSANAPRFVANSPDFELVGLVEGNKLTIWLDHVRTNSPILKGSIEVEVGEIKLQPQLVGEVWVASLPAVFSPGMYVITATVITENTTDLLSGEFVMTDPEVVIPSASVMKGIFWPLVIAGLIALLLLGAVLRRRQRRSIF